MTIADLAAHFRLARTEAKDLMAPFTAAFARAPGRELADWIRLAERHDVQRLSFDGNPPDVPFRFLEPVVPTFEELVARATDDRLPVYELVAFLCGGVPVFINDDPSVDFVLVWARPDGTSPVFYVGDAEGGAYPCAATLEAHVTHVLTSSREQRRSREWTGLEPLPAHLEPGRLEARARWVMRVFHRVTAGSDEADVAGAGTRDEWLGERSLVREWPHLAAHWLLQHMWFGHDAELADVVDATRDVPHPVVQRLRESEWVKPGGNPKEGARAWRARLSAVDPWVRR